MTVEGEGKGVANKLPKLSSLSGKNLFTSLRERGGEVYSTPEGSSKSGSGVIFPSPKAEGLSPVPISPVALALTVNPIRSNLTKLLTPSQTFSRLRDEREEISRQTPTPPTKTCFKDRIRVPLVGQVRLDHVGAACKKWLRNPKNLALLVWGLAVGVSGALLFMVMVGMLDAAIPRRNRRDTLFEVSNQILNALFTLMCLYLHPQRCLHLQMLVRWSSSDVLKLREVYCKNGTRKPHEWAHMLVVVSLLQLNCWAQYALCGLNWGYRRAERPAIGVGLCLCLSMGGAAGAGIYNILSPLGKDFEAESEEGSTEEDLERSSPDSYKKRYHARTKIYKMLERRMSFADREAGSLVEKPEWKGGILDCGQDRPVAVLSTVCCPCVFGWNMDRLGFGNRYVHSITFVLLCTSPFWIFDLAAINIQNRIVRHSIGAAGIVLCGFGLLYGGFWRIRMRERFNLPPNKYSCGHDKVADCVQWMFCPVCSLCQEVRTAEHYDVRDDKFYSRGHRDVASPPPPNANGSHSPRTPATTIPAVQEMPPTGGVKIDGPEMPSTNRFSDLREIANGHSANPFLTPEVLATFNPIAPPPAVTVSTDSVNSVQDGSVSPERFFLPTTEDVLETPGFSTKTNAQTQQEMLDTPVIHMDPPNSSLLQNGSSFEGEEAAYSSSGVPSAPTASTDEDTCDLHTEIDLSLSASRFLPANESPGFSTTTDEELKHISTHNTFIEPNMTSRASLPLSSNSKNSVKPMGSSKSSNSDGGASVSK